MVLHRAILLTCFFVYVGGVLVPPSFSLDHKPQWLGPGLSLESVLSVIALYELDSHVEVVLVGGQSVDVESMKRRLEAMSKISALSSPLSHVHEKIVYHINPDTHLQRKIEDVVLKSSNGAKVRSGDIDTGENFPAEGVEIMVDPQDVSRHLEDYFDQASTATTLFVLDLDVHSLSYDSTLSALVGRGTRHGLPYRYSGASETCHQRAFVSSEKPFAWIDINAIGDDITSRDSDGSGTDLLPTFGMAYNFTSGSAKAAGLAGLVHRSSEGMCQFPYALNAQKSGAQKEAGTSGYYSRHVQSLQQSVTRTFPPRTLDIAVITLCLSGASVDGSCVMDSVAKDVLQGLSTTYASAALSIRSDVVSFDLTTEPQLAHAYFASLRTVEIGKELATVLDTSQFLYWLCMSSLMRELVTNYSGNDGHLPDHEYLPVFVIKGGPSELLFLNDVGVTTMHTPFAEPPGGWGRTSMDKLRPAMRAKDHFRGYHDQAGAGKTYRGEWPKSAILAIRSGRGPSLVDHPLQCGASRGGGGAELSTSGRAALARAREELWGAVVGAVWGVPPPYVHYNGASRSAVRDYLWYSPPAVRDIDVDVSASASQSQTNLETPYFAKRSVSRHAFINKAEGILRHLSSLLSTAQAMDYPVDLAYLLDLPDETDGTKDGEALSHPRGGLDLKKKKSFNAAAKETSGSSGISGGTFESDGLLAEFLRSMDRAASDFSHSDFDLAMGNLGNALAKVELMEQRLQEIILSRSATVMCNSAEDSGSRHSAGPSPGAREGVIEGDGLFGWVMLVSAILAGNWMGKIAKDKVRRRKRKYAL